MSKKISLVLGTRPEAIKLAPLFFALKARSCFQVEVCITAQHRELLDPILDFFKIVPDVDLNLMKSGGGLADLCARIISATGEYLLRSKPDVVVVQGDTTTVFGAAVAAFYNHIPVAHVEAGLRSFDLEQPWPEEANRKWTSCVAAYHFCPTEESRRNLLREGFSDKNIYVTGNTVIDALLMARGIIEKKPCRIDALPEELQPASADGPSIVLMTGHRRENLGEGFLNICHAVRELAQSYPDVHFVYPVHLNPAVRETVYNVLGASKSSNIHLIAPLNYPEFVAMLCRSKFVLTDSGGVQEEAPSLGKPVLVMRDTTERPEGITAGVAKLVGTDPDRIVQNVSTLLDDAVVYAQMATARNPYGDGTAAERIADVLQRD